MERTTIVTVDQHGAPVVRHRAVPGPATEELRHESVVLDLARGLGVVEVVEVVDEPDGGAVLVTRFVPGGTLASLSSDHGERAALVALCRVAVIVDALHRAGIVHGRLTADHVLGRDHDVTLCGLRDARVRADGQPLDAAADTDAFAALVLEVCADDTDLCRRARRAVRSLVGPTPSTNLRVVAGELAELAGVELAEVDRSAAAAGGTAPTARVIGSHRARSVPGAETLGWRIGRTPPSSTSPARRAVAGAAVAVGLGLLGGLALRQPAPPDGAVDEATAGAGRAAANVTRPDGATPDEAPLDEAPPDEAPSDRAGEPTDDLGVAPPVQVWPEPPDDGASGVAGVVVHDGVRYQVGGAGDLVVVGDWDCDGLPTPSLVRPVDGSVWTFTGWAGEGEVLVARSLGFAPTPVAATVVAADDGCDAIAVTTAEGSEVVIEPA